MKKDKIVYRATTGIVDIMMLFSAFQDVTNPQMKTGFVHPGFPDYFRIKPAMAKFAAC